MLPSWRNTMSNYGVVGENVGSVGRWIRFVLGVVVVLFVLTDFYPVSHSHSMAFYIMLALSFAGIVAVFTLVHAVLGDKLKGRSAWWGTIIFVVPTMFLLIYLLNLSGLNHPFRLALILYIGVSFFFQWRDKYGGCEVVSIPNAILRKNYGSYCVPLLPLDAAEKLIVDKFGKS